MRGKVVAGMAGCGALLCGVGGFAVWATVGRRVDVLGASRELPEAVRAYRAAGLPWTAREVGSPVPPNQDAGPALRRAFAAFDDKAWRREWAKAKDDDAKRAALAARFSPALDLAVAAAKRPHYDARRDWDLGPYLLFPDFAEMKGLAQGLAARGRTEDLRAAFRIAGYAGEDGALIGMLVQIACQAIALDGVRRMADLDPARRAMLRRIVEEEFRPADLARSMRAEAYMGLAIGRNLDRYGGAERFGRMAETGKGPKAPDPATLRREGLPNDTMSRAFLARHLQAHVRIAEAMREPDPLRRVERLSAISDWEENQKGMSHLLNAILFPVMRQPALAVVKMEATRRMTLWLLGPRTAPLPPDPFGGTIRSRPDGGSVRLWSVGPNRRDDGGKLRRELPAGERERSDDVVVRGR